MHNIILVLPHTHTHICCITSHQGAFHCASIKPFYSPCKCVCVCVPVYPSACKLKGNISRKKKHLFFIAFLWLPRFIFSTTLAFVSLPRWIKNNKRIRFALCCCCCCCCGFSVFHVKQLIKKLFAPCCTNKKTKETGEKKKRDDRIGCSVTYGITHFRFLPCPCASPFHLALPLARSNCVTPSHLASSSTPPLPKGFCNFLSAQIKKKYIYHPKIKKFLLYFALFVVFLVSLSFFAFVSSLPLPYFY